VEIEPAGTADSLENLGDPKNANFTFVMSGQIKGNQSSGAKFVVPCIPVTQGTHLRPGQCVKCLTEMVHGTGCHLGRLFNHCLKVAKL
jgi:hypothetical protein